jgi:hypothetical protein
MIGAIGTKAVMTAMMIVMMTVIVIRLAASVHALQGETITTVDVLPLRGTTKTRKWKWTTEDMMIVLVMIMAATRIVGLGMTIVRRPKEERRNVTMTGGLRTVGTVDGRALNWDVPCRCGKDMIRRSQLFRFRFLKRLFVVSKLVDGATQYLLFFESLSLLSRLVVFDWSLLVSWIMCPNLRQDLR